MCLPSFNRVPSSFVLALAFSFSAASQVEPPPKDPIAASCYAKLKPALEESKGRLTPAVRKAYVDWARRQVMQDLAVKHQSVTAECLNDVDHDATLQDAMFASVYPPDASILQNYSQIRAQMGAAFAKKYRALATGVAVARRVHGVETDGPSPAVGRDSQGYTWAFDPLHKPANGTEAKFIGLLADFIKAKGCTARDLFEKPELRKQLTTSLKNVDIDPKYVAEIGHTVDFGERLKNALIVLGQRPPAREPEPSCIDWLKHLVEIYSAKPSTPPDMSWPLFPVTDAPWPLLMPLAQPVPMGEAKYLWETFQGEHGPDRFHTYGPYRDDLSAMPDSLNPSHWFWNAVPDQIVHGGVCMQISVATLYLFDSLGLPATEASQPGHANLISYRLDGNTWRTQIEQDYAGGPSVTQSQWYFNDPARHDLHFVGVFGWAGAEYHLGLAVGMNLGLATYMDTRIATHIFEALPDDDRKTTGVKLLDSALEEDPFNPEVWYRLGAECSTTEQSLALLQAVRDHDPAHLAAGAPCTSLQAFLKSGRSAANEYEMGSYWQNIEQNLARFTLLAQGAPKSEEAMRDAYAFLKAVPHLEPGEVSAFTQRYVDFRPADQVAKDVEYDLQLAQKGDPYGNMRMGVRYLDGDGVPRDPTKARGFLIAAAQHGEMAAAYRLETVNVELPNDGIVPLASSTYSSYQDVAHLINGSGMTGGVHDNNGPANSMWHTVDHPVLSEPAPKLPQSPAWVKFTFAQPRTFDGVEIWNENQANLTDRGFRKFTIYGTADNKRWYPITPKTAELPRAGGGPAEPCTYVPTTSSGRLLKAVIIAANAVDGNYGSANYGLSAVRFCVHPIGSAVPAYMIQAMASSEYGPRQSVNHLIDGAGMTGEFHDNNGGAETMWQSRENPVSTKPAPLLPATPAWVRFNFSVPRFIDSIDIWNHNQAKLTNRGLKTIGIYGSSDGIEWFPLTATDEVQLPQATGAPLSASTSFFNISPERPLRSVVIAVDSADGNYGTNCFGLSAVRFIVPPSNPSLVADQPH